MSGLILKLRPHEELLINGVVVQNGDRKTRLRVKTDGTSILAPEGRDAAGRGDDAASPRLLRRAACRRGRIVRRRGRGDLSRAILELRRTEQGEAAAAIARAAEELEAGRFYGGMRRLGEIVRPQNDLAEA